MGRREALPEAEVCHGALMEEAKPADVMVADRGSAYEQSQQSTQGDTGGRGLARKVDHHFRPVFCGRGGRARDGPYP